MAKALDRPQDPVFSSVKVAPSRTPPANVVRFDPFLKPVTQPSQPADTAVGPLATDLSQQKSTAKVSSSTQPEHSTAPTTAQTVQRSVFDKSRKETPSSSDSESESFSSDRPPLGIFPEEGELSDDEEANLSDHDQSLSEEQSFRETMRGIRSYMDWNYIPDIDSGTTTSEDNPFAGPKLHTPGKVSVNLPTDEWLCKKMSKLNLTLVQGYPTRTSEAGGLLKDQFVRPPKSQGERSARESTVICNHAAGFNRCLLKIQQNIATQLKAIRVESKGKGPAKVSSAVDELQFLLDFNSSVCQAMAKSMEHLTEFVFVNMANATLLRRDLCLSYLKAGVKADTLNALRTAPLHQDTLFPDSTVKRAEEDIAAFDKGRSSSVYKSRRYHPYERQGQTSDKKQDRPAWKNLSCSQRRRNKGKQQYSRPAKGQQQYK